MINLERRVNSLVSTFVAEIQGIAKRAAVSMLESSMPAVRVPRTRSNRGKRSPSDLEELSSRFVRLVRAKPGLRIEQINPQIGTTTRELALPIRKLIAEGVIVTEGQKRSTMYYPGKN